MFGRTIQVQGKSKTTLKFEGIIFFTTFAILTYTREGGGGRGGTDDGGGVWAGALGAIQYD